jgi:hypothetical protein
LLTASDDSANFEIKIKTNTNVNYVFCNTDDIRC